MEASALPRSAPPSRPRLAVPGPLLRVRSDDQLVALFRAGSAEAFRTIHDRYRIRLLAYARQMLGGSAADAEDALQEVFVRAHAALLASSSPIALRAWLYRIAHNRCIDQLRRPAPIPSEIMPGAQPALSRGARHDPPAEAERSEDLRRLVGDVHALPEQQRSALLMRELQGLSYEEMSLALGISVAAVKSVLLRARGGVLDAAQARAAPCAEIRLELVSAHDRGVRASGRARRHMRECGGCCAYRGELRAISRRVAGLVPAGPLGHLGFLFGIGGGSGAGGGLAAGGSSAALGGAAGVTATKVAALVCCAALVGSAGELRSQSHRHPARPHAATAAPHPASPPRLASDLRVSARIAGAAIAPAATPGHPVAAAPVRAAAPRPSEAPLTGQDSYGAPPPAGPATDVRTVAPGTDAAAGAIGRTGGTAAADPSAAAGDAGTGTGTETTQPAMAGSTTAGATAPPGASAADPAAGPGTASVASAAAAGAINPTGPWHQRWTGSPHTSVGALMLVRKRASTRPDRKPRLRLIGEASPR